MVTNGATKSKNIYLHVHDLVKKTFEAMEQGWIGVLSTNLTYLHPEKIVTEDYHDRDNRYLVEDLRVVWKDREKG